jgi:AAA domain/UvrD-like helicase C-terminal domain
MATPITMIGEAARMLTEEQVQIVERSIDDRTLVLAGAGAGKSHVLVERIVKLIEDDELQPGQEVLVLSFTRAVVAELRRRLNDRSDKARFVRPMTFDSFASRLLRITPGLEDWHDWQNKSYDGRILAASAAVEQQPAAQEQIQVYRHILVDEVQDLVGPRAEFVLELLRNAGSGFTLLGDPAQGIYDYQLEDEFDLSPDDLLAEIRQEFGDRLSEHVLNKNHRARTAQARLCADAGVPLRAVDRDYNRAEELLLDIVLDAPSIRISELAPALTGVSRPTALLCRTNAQALRFSRELYEHGVDHRLQREATERAMAPWIAEVLRDVPVTSLSEGKFKRRYDERCGAADGISAERAWDLISRTGAVAHDSLDIRRLGEQLRLGLAPDELVEVPDVPVVISTIHRAKGLEFDNVFLVKPELPELGDEDFESEVRVLYVALSRARDDVWTVATPKRGLCRTWHGREDRWISSPWNPKEKWKTFAFEVKGKDVDRMRPPGTWLVDQDAADIQDQLARGVRRGQEVCLELCDQRATAEHPPIYRVVHQQRPIAVTSEDFGRLLESRIRPWRDTDCWPRAISRVFVDGVDSVAGTPGTGEAAGLGVSDIWLRPRLIGLGKLHWNDDWRTD